jgi:hypothetical protein
MARRCPQGKSGDRIADRIRQYRKNQAKAAKPKRYSPLDDPTYPPVCHFCERRRAPFTYLLQPLDFVVCEECFVWWKEQRPEVHKMIKALDECDRT